jgi:hypothetical protein
MGGLPLAFVEGSLPDDQFLLATPLMGGVAINNQGTKLEIVV